MATPSGDGKTSPFGDGTGKVRGDQMAQGGEPDPKYTESRPQQQGTAYDISTSDAAPGGSSVFGDLDKTSDPGNPIGQVPGDAQRKPFRITQG